MPMTVSTSTAISTRAARWAPIAVSTPTPSEAAGAPLRAACTLRNRSFGAPAAATRATASISRNRDWQTRKPRRPPPASDSGETAPGARPGDRARRHRPPCALDLVEAPADGDHLAGDLGRFAQLQVAEDHDHVAVDPALDLAAAEDDDHVAAHVLAPGDQQVVPDLDHVALDHLAQALGRPRRPLARARSGAAGHRRRTVSGSSERMISLRAWKPSLSCSSRFSGMVMTMPSPASSSRLMVLSLTWNSMRLSSELMRSITAEKSPTERSRRARSAADRRSSPSSVVRESRRSPSRTGSSGGSPPSGNPARRPGPC